MANDYYVHGTAPLASSQMLSAPIRNEFDLVTAGFNVFPPLAAGANNLVKTNSLGTALETTPLLVINDAFSLGSTNGTVYSIGITQQINGTFTLPPVSATLSTYNSRANYLYGLTVANDVSDATNDLDIAVGSGISTESTIANRVVMTLSSALVKRADATWVTGTNQGGRTSSVALADGGWHVYLIRVAGVDDVGFDTSASGANLVTDHGATNVRRIASVSRIAGAWQQFIQRNNTFLLKTINSSNSTLNPGTSEQAAGPTANTYPVLAQNDFYICAHGGVDNTAVGGSPATVYVWHRLSGGLDLAATEANHWSLISQGRAFGRAMLKLRNTGTLGTIRYRLSASDATTRFRVTFTAWVDGRGRRRDF